MASLSQIGDTLLRETRMASVQARTLGYNRTNLALGGWVTVILAAGLLPLQNFVGHAHWDHIQWTITPTHWHSLRFYFDIIANVTLFFPLGLLLSRVRKTRTAHTITGIMGLGFLLSLGIEAFQIFCHNRHPSLFDVISNVTGTALGAGAATRIFSVRYIDELFPISHSHPTGS